MSEWVSAEVEVEVGLGGGAVDGSLADESAGRAEKIDDIQRPQCSANRNRTYYDIRPLTRAGKWSVLGRRNCAGRWNVRMGVNSCSTRGNGSGKARLFPACMV